MLFPLEQVSLHWDAAMASLPKLYMKPPFAPRHYYYPWSCTMYEHFLQSHRAAVTIYLGKQQVPIRPVSVKSCLANESTKFEMPVTRAYWTRIVDAFSPFGAFATEVSRILQWESFWISVAANILWILFAFFPLEVITVAWAAGSVYVIHRLVRCACCVQVPRMNADLFGGLKVVSEYSDDEEEDEDSSPGKLYNPVAVLQKKLAALETTGMKVCCCQIPICSWFAMLPSALKVGLLCCLQHSRCIP